MGENQRPAASVDFVMNVHSVAVQERHDGMPGKDDILMIVSPSIVIHYY